MASLLRMLVSDAVVAIFKHRGPGHEAIDLRGVLGGISITSSAPARLDCGGTLDLPTLSLQLEESGASSVTIAVSLRANATLRAGEKDTVVVDSLGIGHEETTAELLPISGPFALVNAIIRHFGVSGFHLTLRSDVPPGSGLGGSGTVSVAVIAAICSALAQGTDTGMPDGFRIAQMAREAENSLPGGLTGLQDQLSAVFGGVNMWKWHYARQAQPFDRRVLLCEYDIDWLSRRIAVAFSGDLRNSSSVSMQYIEDYLAGKTCQEWIEICGMVSMFAAALQEKDGEAALKALQGEMRMRDQICADLWPASALALKAAADRFGCVTRTGGGNRAGCIWSFGEPEAIAALKKEWGNACLCAEVVSAGLELTCRKGD